MADYVVNFLVEYLSQQLEKEANIFGGVEDQVKSLHRELRLINIFLENSVGKRNEHAIVKEVVGQIREVAYEAEDVIDMFILKVTVHRSRSLMGRIFLSPKHAMTLRDVGNKIAGIKNAINEIYNNRERYGIERATESVEAAAAAAALHKLRREVEEDDVVGFLDDSTTLVKHLTEGDHKCDVISIIGMGGLGKTTLARKIYNNVSVKSHFECRAWVYVSQDFRTRELLLKILKQMQISDPLEGMGMQISDPRRTIEGMDMQMRTIEGMAMQLSDQRRRAIESMDMQMRTIEGMAMQLSDQRRRAIEGMDTHMRTTEGMDMQMRTIEGMAMQLSDQRRRTIEAMDMQISDMRRTLEGMGVRKLKEQLFTCLRRKRYLIVMDDIWKTEVWDEVRSAFPDDMNGSRILITSRITEVASHASLTPPYFLPVLNKDESWELLSKKVFRGGTCPPELETMGKKIVDACHGLPLSIVVLGGLLANKKKTPQTWSKLIGNVNWYLTEANTICKDILALSYTNLPRRLQPCFLYFGVYPEDFEIPVKQLIHLWTAEGFIQHSGNRRVEDVAEDYLEELIDRSLIQVASRKTDGGVKTCRIHDLLRDLCISESKEDKFLELLRDDNRSFPNKSRRLSVHGNFPLYTFPNFSDPPCARSLLCFGDVEDRDRDLFVKSFKLIRVINFERTIFQSIPKSIETMIHLRYLKIKLSDKVMVIPDSIGNLTNLETLFIEGSGDHQGYSVTGIFKLKRLRNLFLKTILPLPYHLDEALWNLQVLSTALLCYDEEKTFPVALDKFPCVRKLKIKYICMSRNLKFGDRSKVVDYLEGLHHLHYLQILRIDQFPMLPSDSSSFPSTITQLTIQNVRLGVGGGMTMLGNLPNLGILKIKSCEDIIDLHIFGGSFRRLKVLKLQDLQRVKEWKQERSAMPCLIYLVIGGCHCLTMLPPELWSLTALEKVEVLNPSSKLAHMLQELRMKVSCKLVIE